MQDKIKIKSKNGDEFEIDPKDYPHLKFSSNPVNYEKTHNQLLVELASDYVNGEITAEQGMRILLQLVLPQPVPTPTEIAYAKKLSISYGGHCKPISNEEATEFFKDN